MRPAGTHRNISSYRESSRRLFSSSALNDSKKKDRCGRVDLFCSYGRSDGRVVSASVSGTVDLGLISSRVKPMTLTLVLTASLQDAQH